VSVAERVFRLVDEGVTLQVRRQDGASVEPADVILTVAGPAASLLEAERTALNVMAHLSGIATLTARYVTAVKGTRARIVDTRKTTPGLRALESVRTTWSCPDISPKACGRYFLARTR
jgi:nicotinate-nucleotide pyrophosphorylase (carboxylating)